MIKFTSFLHFFRLSTYLLFSILFCWKELHDTCGFMLTSDVLWGFGHEYHVPIIFKIVGMLSREIDGLSRIQQLLTIKQYRSNLNLSINYGYDWDSCLSIWDCAIGEMSYRATTFENFEEVPVCNRVPLLQVLLAAGVRPNIGECPSAIILLMRYWIDHNSCVSNTMNCIEVLIKGGCELAEPVYSFDRWSTTVLHYLFEQCYSNCSDKLFMHLLRFYIAAGVDSNMMDQGGHLVLVKQKNFRKNIFLNFWIYFWFKICLYFDIFGVFSSFFTFFLF